MRILCEKKELKINLKKHTRMAVNSTARQKKDKQSKERTKRSSYATKFMITIVVFVIAIAFIVVSGSFDITEIMVENNEVISADTLISFSGIQKGTNIFAISKKNIENRLKQNSYINDVKIKRVFPNKVKLIIEERKLEFALQLAGSYVYIDRQGYVLEISNQQRQVPIIVGFTTDLSNIKQNDRLSQEDLQKMNMVVKIMETAIHTNLEKLLTRIDVSNEMNYTIYLDTENKIAYLGDGNQLNIRFLYIKKLLEIYQGKSGEIVVNVDLNSEYVYFRESI